MPKWRSTSSGTFPETSHTARAPEWLHITGARDVECCERGSVRRVREVDGDPETIKFLDEHLAKPTVTVATTLAP